MKVTNEDACVILPRHELADSYPRLQSALPRRRVELMKTRSPRVEPQTYHVTVSISLDDARSTCPSAPAWVAAVRHKGIFGGASSPSRALVEANEQRLDWPNGPGVEFTNSPKLKPIFSKYSLCNKCDLCRS